MKVENTDSDSHVVQEKSAVKVIVAHGDGNYFASNDTLDELEDNGQVAFRIVTPQRLDPRHRRHFQQAT